MVYLAQLQQIGFSDKERTSKKSIFQASAYNEIVAPADFLSVSLYFICMEEFSLWELIKGRKSPEVLQREIKSIPFD